MYLLKKMPASVKIKDLKDCVEKFADHTTWGETGQICYTNTKRTNDINESFEGAGSLYYKFVETKEGRKRVPKDPEGRRERDFQHFNQAYKDTPIEKLYKEVSRMDYKIGRMRAIRIEPGVCLSGHRDNNPRLHLVLNTNEDTFFVFDRKEVIHLPADNILYLMNTTRRHTMVNSGSEYRTHLILDILGGPGIKEAIEETEKLLGKDY